ncbi:MAG: uroporphyrinogen-III synthase [Chlamydiia bacterium]|nr:uroporphyrinogen-III synthase [Chlamydiia bacterium]
MTTLYTGLDPSRYPEQVLHCPLIEIVPLFPKLDDLSVFTHFVVTSKSAAKLIQIPSSAFIIAVGRATADAVGRADLVAEDERQEGIIAILESMDLTGANICLPRSKKARRLMDQYLLERGVSYQVIELYDVQTKVHKKYPDLSTIKKVVFTSPSTVRAFIEIYGALPEGKELIAIGPVTRKAIEGECYEPEF